MKKSKKPEWDQITISDFSEHDLPKWLFSTYKQNTFTKFLHMLDHYNNIGEMYDAGPWDWLEQPAVGYKTVQLATHIINHYAGVRMIPSFTSVVQIQEIGEYVEFLKLKTALEVLTDVAKEAKKEVKR